MTYLTAPTRHIQVAGKAVAYRDLGEVTDAPTLVMLVHLAATMDNWDPALVDLIAAQRRVVVVDLPGVGSSEGDVATTIPAMARQVTDFIDALGLTEIDLLGLSMGGMIAQEVVRGRPDLVAHLVLVGTGPRAGVGIDRVTSRTFFYMARAALRRTDPKRYIFYTHDERGKAEAAKALGRLASREPRYAGDPMSVRGFLRQLVAIRRWGRDAHDDLAWVAPATLIVNGDQDMMVPTSNSYDMHKRIVGSELIIYPDAGHGSIFQYASRFADDLAQFLAS
ncbi:MULTISPECIES: alpha/beta fold hydrolase [Actinomyces]|uniref:Alpha/beta hydrolase n=1 Tax=Actinomyces respiraculi TaxID=2744574 RepID=A0A7T0PXC8_9ACTO|nr:MULTISPECIES: alpha/beta hydrolase [Actinomyces]QPL05705.1 alpha/beta hydrolase [Actinomyces respiraculi]